MNVLFNYGSSWNEVQHRKIMFALNRELDAYVKSLGDPLVELLPLGHAVDTEDGYVNHEEPLSAVSKTKVRRNCNAVHPNDVGGLQMGDTISAWLRARWNDFGVK